jgi:hypothetical protein
MYAARFFTPIIYNDVFSTKPGGVVTNLHSHLTDEDYARFPAYWNEDHSPTGWEQTIEQCTAT